MPASPHSDSASNMPRLPWRHRVVGRYLRSANHPGRLRLLRWLRQLLGLRAVRVEVTPGVVMELDDTDFVQKEILWEGCYERETVRLFDRLLADANGFLDIGAHHGQYALRAARALASRGSRVFAFEPSPANAAALLRNAAFSGLTNLDVCTTALSHRPSVLRIVEPIAGNTGGSHLAESNEGGSGVAVHVSVRPFGDFVHLIPADAFGLVKIDVEGYEARVLDSMFASSAPRPRHILLEYRPADFNYAVPEGLPAWLDRHGYRVRMIDGRDYLPGLPLPEDNLWAELR